MDRWRLGVGCHSRLFGSDKEWGHITHRSAHRSSISPSIINQLEYGSMSALKNTPLKIKLWIWLKQIKHTDRPGPGLPSVLSVFYSGFRLQNPHVFWWLWAVFPWRLSTVHPCLDAVTEPHQVQTGLYIYTSGTGSGSDKSLSSEVTTPTPRLGSVRSRWHHLLTTADQFTTDLSVETLQSLFRESDYRKRADSTSYSQGGALNQMGPDGTGEEPWTQQNHHMIVLSSFWCFLFYQRINFCCDWITDGTTDGLWDNTWNLNLRLNTATEHVQWPQSAERKPGTRFGLLGRTGSDHIMMLWFLAWWDQSTRIQQNQDQMIKAWTTWFSWLSLQSIGSWEPMRDEKNEQSAKNRNTKRSSPASSAD